MQTATTNGPNISDAAPVNNAVPSLDQIIAEKMAAMRNQVPATEQPETGESMSAEIETPVAPEPEIDSDEEQSADSTDESTAPEETEVSQENSSDADIIDFLEFAETHPNAKFKFMRNGQVIEIDAKKAASILGQGAAISEDARKLKIERAEFDEYLAEQRNKQEGLTLAMEFTIRPQLQKAYDEIIKTQGYQNTFRTQLAQTQDPAAYARIQANMAQNEQYIQQQSNLIRNLKPNIDQFYQIRQQQVAEQLDKSRRSFKDRELKNEYVYNEIRDKVSKGWEGATRQLVPGINNIDLIASDEHLMSLLRDGLKFRDKPSSRSSGASIAALTNNRRGSSMANNNNKDEISNLRERAKGGDKKAADNLLVAQMKALRAQRSPNRR